MTTSVSSYNIRIFIHNNMGYYDPPDVSSALRYPTPFSNSPLLPLLLATLATQKQSPKTSLHFASEYDYIIVGAGAAGSVVASRLSELPCVRVLLLEAGGPAPIMSDIPAIARSFVMTDVDWNYRTVPQKHTGAGLVNRQVTWPSGKALGGSTILNALLYYRGNRRNYDEWEKMGAKGWSYKDVLPYFKKSEDNRDPDIAFNGYHGVGGPLTVERERYDTEIKSAVIEASVEMGYPPRDSNKRIQIGLSDVQGTARNGQRCSVAKAFLVPAEDRKNLDIIPFAFVKKIIIHNRRAVAVQFDYRGKQHEVRARREIIMSAGTVNSAQLLMLSGIGPREHLETHGIKVIADLPVGLNFHDHPGTAVSFELSNKLRPYLEKLTDPKSILQYINNRTGPLASFESLTNVAFCQNSLFTDPELEPDYELYFGDIALLTVDMLRIQYGITDEVYKQAFAPYANKTTAMCAAQLTRPKSRGTVRLRSRDPYKQPLIDPNYLSHPEDIQNLVAGLLKCVDFITSDTFRKLGAILFLLPIPGCEKYVLDMEEYLQCAVRTAVITFSHQVGTCKMGDPRDPTTVVDPELRVKGIKGLRVVDASIMPKVVNSNTMAPTIMIGEKASDMIKKEISCSMYSKHKMQKREIVHE